MGHALSQHSSLVRSIGMRATSMGAAALLIGVSLIVALSSTYRIHLPEEIAGISIESITERTPPPTPPPPTTQPPMRPVVVDPQAPAQPTELISDPTPISDTQPIATPYVGPPTISAPHWLRQPSNLARYYPRRALERNQDGRVELDCLVAVTGLLNCSVASETPQAFGFGEAALRISRDYQMVPARQGGEPVIGRYRMVVPFTLQ